MTDVLAAIRELHAPADDFYLECRGCDSDGFEAETPAWPCRTANLVYTPDEIATALEAAKERRIARREAAAKNLSPAASLIPSIWQERIMEQLAADPILAHLRDLR